MKTECQEQVAGLSAPNLQGPFSNSFVCVFSHCLTKEQAQMPKQAMSVHLPYATAKIGRYSGSSQLQLATPTQVQ